MNVEHQRVLGQRDPYTTHLTLEIDIVPGESFDTLMDEIRDHTGRVHPDITQVHETALLDQIQPGTDRMFVAEATGDVCVPYTPLTWSTGDTLTAINHEAMHRTYQTTGTWDLFDTDIKPKPCMKVHPDCITCGKKLSHPEYINDWPKEKLEQLKKIYDGRRPVRLMCCDCMNNDGQPTENIRQPTGVQILEANTYTMNADQFVGYALEPINSGPIARISLQ